MRIESSERYSNSMTAIGCIRTVTNRFTMGFMIYVYHRFRFIPPSFLFNRKLASDLLTDANEGVIRRHENAVTPRKCARQGGPKTSQITMPPQPRPHHMQRSYRICNVIWRRYKMCCIFTESYRFVVPNGNVSAIKRKWKQTNNVSWLITHYEINSGHKHSRTHHHNNNIFVYSKPCWNALSLTVEAFICAAVVIFGRHNNNQHVDGGYHHHHYHITILLCHASAIKRQQRTIRVAVVVMGRPRKWTQQT